MSLISDLFKDQFKLWTFNLSEEDKNLQHNYYNLIKENLIIYDNKYIQDIYPNNDWIKISYKYTRTTISICDIEMELATFKCVKTNSFVFTFSYNQNRFLHPFNIVKHKFKLTNVESSFINYKCDNCEIRGFKIKNVKHAEIEIDSKYMMYSCDDMIIKGIIE